MNTDCYFARGKTHLVCEDYALVGEAPPRMEQVEPLLVSEVAAIPYVLVSDGCSSSRHTDVGARRLCFSAGGVLSFGEHVSAQKVLEHARTLPLMHQGYGGPNYLDATLLAAYPFRKVIEVVASGDGVFCARRRADQVIETHQISFNGNAPGYASYLLDPERGDSYAAEHGFRTVRVYEGRELANAYIQKVLTAETEHIDYAAQFPIADYDLVALFSDGVESFQRETSRGQYEPVDLFDVLDQLLAIKNTTGQFVVRRMRRFLGRYCKLVSWHHNDDVSMAAIYIPEDLP